jgi:hypothetical protein
MATNELSDEEVNRLINSGRSHFIRSLLMEHPSQLSLEQCTNLVYSLERSKKLSGILSSLSQLSSKQYAKVADAVIEIGSVNDNMQLLMGENNFSRLSPEQCIKAVNRVIASKYTSSYVMNLLKKPLSSEQRKKAVDRVIADSFNSCVFDHCVLDLLKKYSSDLNCAQITMIFPTFERNLLEFEIEIFCLVVKKVKRQQVQSFFKRSSNRLNEQQLSIVQERLSTIESLTKLCCEYFQQPDTSQPLKDSFNELIQLEGFDSMKFYA